MADNLQLNELAGFYLATYELQKTLASLHQEEAHYRLERDDEFPFDDEEYAEYLELMKNELSEKFAAFVTSRLHGRTYLPRNKGREERLEFWRQEKKAWQKIKDYRESRPDLYD